MRKCSAANAEESDVSQRNVAACACPGKAFLCSRHSGDAGRRAADLDDELAVERHERSMKRFFFRFVLSILGVWVASFLVPGVTADKRGITFFLAGLFIAVGEMALPVVEGGTAVVLFFLPRTIRVFALRLAIVAIAAQLTEGFGFSAPLPGLFGTTLLLTLLYALPFAQ